MKSINNYINEKLVISKKLKKYQYTCQPKDKGELKEIIKDRLEADKDANLNDIDVSQITDMSDLFVGLDPHNIDISEWDVYNVIDMLYMFDGCENFNCDLSKWDVSNVIAMSGMFYGCKSLKNKPSWYKE